MAGYITDFFGYNSSDTSKEALVAAAQSHCPSLGKECLKSLRRGRSRVLAGACAVCQVKDRRSVICCPHRLYADDYKLLHIIGERAFGRSDLGYYAGKDAVPRAIAEHGAIAVFGHGWGGELKLPTRSEGVGKYFVDWVLARLDEKGLLAEFTAIEVQTIDTTGNYHASRDALLNGRHMVPSKMGLNWENVNKRILPQLIYKGQVLQREKLCKSGLWFVAPGPVFERIQERLGGADNIGFGFPFQPGAIHFLRYDYDPNAPIEPGKVRPLAVIGCDTTTVERVHAAFGHVVLPEAGVYEKSLRDALGQGWSVEYVG